MEDWLDLLLYVYMYVCMRYLLYLHLSVYELARIILLEGVHGRNYFYSLQSDIMGFFIPLHNIGLLFHWLLDYWGTYDQVRPQR